MQPPSRNSIHLLYSPLHLPPTSSFQPLLCSLQLPQRYKSKNIARKWETSPNLDRKIQSCLFFLKINNMVSSRFWFRIQTYIFKIPITKPIFGQIWAKKSKLFVLSETWNTWYLEDCDSYSDISFLKFQI